MSNDAQVELPSLLDLLASATGLDLGSVQAQNYVKRLASLGLEDLKHEPAIIANERVTVESELVNLCYREYPTFTSVHRCSSAVGSAFDDFDTSLGDLINSIPALEQECRHFSQHNLNIQASRRKAVLLQDHEDKLLNVLEIPQLMETCVRNGHYQEALDLAAHVKSVHNRISIAVVSDIAREVENVLQLMTAQLLGILREPVKLPALLKAVNYLRRLQSLDDEDIALVFLSSRLHNYRARLVDIEKHRAEPVRYLRKYIDLFREHVFDIISQYTTIFSGDLGTLQTFACLCVEDLVDLVRRYIPRIASDSASVSSIMVQLGYCSLSFSRVGLDFSALLAEPFTASILSSFSQAVSSAADLMTDTLSAPGSSPSTLLISTQHLAQILADPISPPLFSIGTDLHIPPAILAQYPPLAQLLNSHLASLNALRLLAPFQLGPALSSSQSYSFQQVTDALQAYIEEAVSEDTAPPLARAHSGSRHSRTGSTPRAQLIRRNTETQLSSETLLARRRETKRVCVAFADAWLHTIRFLRDGLAQVLEQEKLDNDHQLQSCVERMASWIKDNGEVEATEKEASDMANVDEEVEIKSPPVRPTVITSPTIPASVSPASPPSPVSPTPQRQSLVHGNISPPQRSMVPSPKASMTNISLAVPRTDASTMPGEEETSHDKQDITAGPAIDPEPAALTEEPVEVIESVSMKDQTEPVVESVDKPISGEPDTSTIPPSDESATREPASRDLGGSTQAGGEVLEVEDAVAKAELNDASITMSSDKEGVAAGIKSPVPVTVEDTLMAEATEESSLGAHHGSPPHPASKPELDERPEAYAEPVNGNDDPSPEDSTPTRPDDLPAPGPAQIETPVEIANPVAESAVSKNHENPAIEIVERELMEEEEGDDGTRTPGSVGTTVGETSNTAEVTPKTSTSSKKKKKKKGKK